MDPGTMLGIGFAVVVVISVFVLKGFDRVAGRGPSAVKKGIESSSLAAKETPPSKPKPNKLSELKKLGELKEKGVLSEEEFQMEKKKLLGS